MSSRQVIDGGRWPDLLALVPAGGGTQVIFRGGGTYQDRRPVLQVVADLAKFFQEDLPELEARCRLLLKGKRRVPLPLQRDLMLVPLAFYPRSRQPEERWGYVVKKQIIMYRAAGQGTTCLYFYSGTYLMVRQPLEQVRKILQEATELQQRYWHVYLVPPPNGSTLGEGPNSEFFSRVGE